MLMTRRALFRTAFVLLLSYGGLCLVGGILLCEGTLHPMRRPLLPAEEQSARALADRQGALLQDVALTTRDGAILRAWLFHPEQANGTAVILLHGLSDNRMGMIGYAEFLLRHLFTILMPDARAHGASGGAIATYGLLERDDVRAWFQWLTRAVHPSCIDGFGESMGAAQMLQAVAVEQRFCAVAAESSFSTFREIGYDRIGQFFHARGSERLCSAQ
jgi:predicted alpha/beta-fold hydrolase